MSRATKWTQNLLQWRNWVPVVEERTERQQEVLSSFSTPQQQSPYYRALVHSPEILRARTDLYNEALQGEKGGSRPYRELAAVASSRETGCVYCASVHARAYSGLVRDKSKIQPLLEDGIDADLPAPESAIAKFAARIASAPDSLTSAHVRPLRDQGFSDEEILNISYAAAIFANANRLMLTLGEGEVPDSQ